MIGGILFVLFGFLLDLCLGIGYWWLFAWFGTGAIVELLMRCGAPEDAVNFATVAIEVIVDAASNIDVS